MAVTRINNNQVTDAITGNAVVGINAGTKLQAFSITATRIANNLTYGSDLTVAGNLTVQGQTTTVDTVNTLIQDPLITLADGQTSGAPSLDIGTIGLRGSQLSAVLGWKESALEFVTALSNTTVSNTTFNISSYANLHTGNFIAQGTTSLVGNIIGAVNATDTITGGNLATAGTASAGGNITGGNLLTGGLVSATGSVTGGNIFTAGNVSATGNVTGGNVIAGNAVVGNISLSGDINVANINATGYVSVVGNTTVGNLLTGGLASVTGNITGGNLLTAGTVIAATVNAAAIGNIGAAVTAATVSAATIGNAGAALQGATASLTANVTAGNLITTGITNTGSLETTGNALIGGNLIVQGNISYININDLRVEDPVIILGTGPNGAPLTTNDGLDRGIYMEYYISNVGTSNAFMGFDNSTGNMFIANDVRFTANDIVGVNSYGTLQAGNLYIQSAVSTGNVTSGNLVTAGLTNTGTLAVSSTSSFTGNITSAFNVTGNITGGNLITAGNVFAPAIIANSSTYDTRVSLNSTAGIIEITSNGNATQFGPSGTISLSGASQINGGTFGGSGLTLGASQTDIFQNRGGNVTVQVGTGGTINSTWTFTNSGNLLAPGNISATGNVTGGNIVTSNTVTGANVIGTTSGQFGNIVISGDDITDTNGRVNINTAGADVDFAVNGDTLANVFYVDAGTGTASFGNSTQITNAIASFNVTSSMVIPRGNILQRPATGVTGMMRFNSTTNSLEIYNNTDWIGVGSTVFTVITDQQFNGDGVNVAFTLANASTTASTIVSINGVLQIPTSAYSVANVTLTFTEAPAPGDLIDVRALTTTSTLTNIQNVSGNASIAVSDTSATVSITGDLTVTGNATVLGNIATDQILNGSTRIEIPDPNQDIHFDINGVNEVFLVGQFDSRFTGNVNPGANVTYNLGNTANRWNTVWSNSLTVGNITNANGNGVGNIGSSSTYFNTVFAKATSAQYADLAEKYTADAEYTPGTVLVFGGTAEVTVNAVAGDTKVAGVVSTNPSYTMNSGLESEHVATVALTGRVPTMVVGPVRKGDLMVAAGLGRAQSSIDPKVGSVIGKALEDFDGVEGTIEVVVGRF
jgi:filamentous hemagglutinin